MYGSVARIAEAFPNDMWDPARHEPNSVTVTNWLTERSKALDGQIAGMVETPVTSADSPKLHSVCEMVVVLQVRADVYDAKYPPGKGEQVTTRQSYVWRDEAAELIKGIQKGVVADGLPANETASDTLPIGGFGSSNDRFGQRDGKW